MAEPPILDPAAFLLEHVVPRAGRRVTELRGQIARLERELTDRLAATATVHLELEGEGGGSWYLNLRDGEMRLAEQPAETPIVRIRQTREDWEALTRAELAEGGGPGTSGDLTASRIARLRGLEGGLEFRLGLDDRVARIVVQFGEGERSGTRCVLTLRAADARRMQAGELPPQVAFMQGLVKLEGDVAFAMQVGGALLL